MSAPDHTNNGPRANDAVANRGDGGQGAGASRQGPAAAAADHGDDETANEFGSFYQGGFGYRNSNSNNRNPSDGTWEYVPAVRDDPSKQDEKSRTFHRCQPPPEDPPGGPSEKDGDSSNRT